MRGVATWHSLRRVLACVAEKQPDVMLLTGDLAHNGDPAAYDLLHELVSDLNIPAYWLPGNHDCPDIARDHLSRAPFVTADRVELGGWNLILLDSTLATATYGEGEISPDRLQQLRLELDVTDRPTAIALHHHPIPMNIDWLDTIGVTNARELLAQLNRSALPTSSDLSNDLSKSIKSSELDHKNPVKLVMFGHTHLEFAGDRTASSFMAHPPPVPKCYATTPPTSINSPASVGSNCIPMAPTTAR